MDEEDKNDIIKKINTSGGNDENNSGEDNNDDMADSGNDNETGDDNGFGDDGIEDNFGDEGLSENKMTNLMSEPVKCDMFQPGSNDKLKGHDLYKTNESIVPKKVLLKKLHESLNDEEIKKEVPVNRRNMPFVGKTKQDIEEDKTKNNYQVYHNDFMSALQEIINYVHSRGLSLDRQEWENEVGHDEDIQELNDGEVKMYKLPLYKDGQQLREMCQVQIEKTGNKYELNMYFN